MIYRNFILGGMICLGLGIAGLTGAGAAVHAALDERGTALGLVGTAPSR